MEGSMFSNNGRISEKQMRRTLVLPVFAGCIFVLPHFAAKLFGDLLYIDLPDWKMERRNAGNVWGKR